MKPVTSRHHLLELKNDTLAALAAAFTLPGLEHLRVRIGRWGQPFPKGLDVAAFAVDLWTML
jgi:hypothetical protein